MVDIFLSARTALFPGGEPLAGVRVSIHTPVGLRLTAAITGEDGVAFLGDREAGTYEIRVTPPSGAELVPASPRFSIIVPDGDDAQVYDCVVLLGDLPVSPYEHLCRCSGRFVDLRGLPRKGAVIRFLEVRAPVLLIESASNQALAVINDQVSLRTDDSGYAVADLIRGAVYQIEIGDSPVPVRSVQIPDLPASSLPDVIFPLVDRVEYELDDEPVLPANNPAVEVAVGEEITLAVTTVHRSGLRISGLVDVSYSGSDDEIALFAYASSEIKITGVSAGEAELVVTRAVSTFETASGDSAGGVRVRPTGELGGRLRVTVV